MILMIRHADNNSNSEENIQPVCNENLPNSRLLLLLSDDKIFG